jgi:hypothetical protein
MVHISIRFEREYIPQALLNVAVTGQLCKDTAKAASDLNETLTNNINER